MHDVVHRMGRLKARENLDMTVTSVEPSAVAASDTAASAGSGAEVVVGCLQVLRQMLSADETVTLHLCKRQNAMKDSQENDATDTDNRSDAIGTVLSCISNAFLRMSPNVVAAAVALLCRLMLSKQRQMVVSRIAAADGFLAILMAAEVHAP